MEDVIHRSYNTDRDFWLKKAEEMTPKGDGPTGPDLIARYGVNIQDSGGRWIRHFVDVPNGRTHTLCGAVIPTGEKPYDVHRTCDRCSEIQGRMRGR